MNKFFKIAALTLLFVAAIFASFACKKKSSPAASAKSESVSSSAAKSEEKKLKGKLVICSSATDLDLEAIQEGFNELYPDVEIEFVYCSAGEGIARIQAEGDNPSIDVIYSGMNQADGDRYKAYFEPYLSKYESQYPKEYQSNNGYYNYDHLSTVCFCVNKELEKSLGLDIKGYADLMDPRLKGKIIFSDPNSSSAAWNNLSNIFAAFGNDSAKAWEVVEGLLANGMVVGSSSSTCFKGVEKGEYVVGLTYEDGASTLLKNGSDKIRMVYPAEGASAFAFAAAIVKKAPNMENAKALIDWLQEPKGQSFRANYVGTVRFTHPDVKVEKSWLPDSKGIKWVVRDIDWLIANKTAMLEKWNGLYNKYNK